MKRRVAVVLFFLIMVSGCVSVNYNPETKEIKYHRWFTDQKLAEVSLKTDDKGITKFSMGSQESSNEQAMEAMKALLSFMDFLKNSASAAEGIAK